MHKGFWCCAVAWLAIGGCSEGPYQRDATPVSFRIIEVVDCKPSMQPLTVNGSSEKYCLAAQPIVTEADVRDARPGTNESDRPILNLYFTHNAGERLRSETQRINSEHFARGDRGRLAMVVDGKLVSAANLYDTLADTIVVTMASKEEARKVAAGLNAPRPRGQ
jgi:preprotein translocase subunit SecD